MVDLPSALHFGPRAYDGPRALPDRRPASGGRRAGGRGGSDRCSRRPSRRQCWNRAWSSGRTADSFLVAGRLVADARAAAARPAVEADSAGEAHSEIEYREAGGNSRKEFWELFFETKDPWNYGSRYEQVKYEQTLSLLPDAALGRALEIACAEGMFTQKLAPRVGHLFGADISSKALQRAAQRCGSV